MSGAGSIRSGPVPEQPPTPPLVVALDGPSGSGKSTVARRVASALALRFLDTGAMYRAVTWRALDRGLDLADQDAVAEVARRAELRMGTDPATPTVSIDGADVTAAIRETRISEAVSAVATNLAVRSELVARQQAAIRAEPAGIVAEGRDITTVVAPEAPVRVLLTASGSARLARRARELHGSDDPEALAATTAQVHRRDARDSTVADFMQAADGVDVVDSSHLTLDETVAAVLALVAERTGAASGGPARPH